MLHHDQPKRWRALIEEFLGANGAVLRHPSRRIRSRGWCAARRTSCARGGLIAYPTDSCYALGCHARQARRVERLRRIRGIDERHHLTLMCRDLSEIAQLRDGRRRALPAAQARRRRAATPSSCARTREVPRRLLHPKRKTIGVRVPGHPVAHALLAELGEPMLSADAAPAGRRRSRCPTPSEIRERLEHADRPRHRRRLLRRRAEHGDRSDRRRADGAARRARARSRRSRWKSRLIESALHKMDVNSPRPDVRHLRAPGAVRDHAARGGAWLCRAPFRRHDGARAGPRQPESAAAHRPGRHDHRAAR